MISTYYTDTGKHSWGIEKYFDSNLSWHDYNDSTGEYLANRILLDSQNYTGYTVTRTGSGASGTWGINISGNAATATIASGNLPHFFLTASDIASYIGLTPKNATSGWYHVNGADGVVLPTTNYGSVLLENDTGTPYQIFFPDNSLYLYKRWSASGTWNSWSKMSAGYADSAGTATTAAKLGRGGNTSYPMIFNWSGQDGQPTWLWGGTDGTNMYVYNPANFTVNYANGANYANEAMALRSRSDITYGWDGLQYFNASLGTTASSTANYAPTADWYHIIRMNHANTNGYYVDLAACFHSDNFYFKRVASGANSGYKHIWVEGNSVTSAVWNDYAEYRESTTTKPGLVVFENGDDTLSPTTERLSHFAGVVSDTWGFCQGETERAKTPIAVAGRVLAYTYQDRNKYKPGDCVCAAPNGTVDIMTREEVIQYPDRIVGTVSCIPDYEEWGQGDRPAVKVDGRIWIKVN